MSAALEKMVGVFRGGHLIAAFHTEGQAEKFVLPKTAAEFLEHQAALLEHGETVRLTIRRPVWIVRWGNNMGEPE